MAVMTKPLEVAAIFLANSLRTQGKFVEESRGIYERFLAISIRNEGPDGSNAAIGNKNLGLFYYHLAREQATVDLKQTQLLLAKSHLKEALRICLKYMVLLIQELLLLHLIWLMLQV
jgi:hypothetical protein